MGPDQRPTFRRAQTCSTDAPRVPGSDPIGRNQPLHPQHIFNYLPPPAPHRPLTEGKALVHVDCGDSSWAAQPFPSFSCRRRWADPLLRRFWTYGFQVRELVSVARLPPPTILTQMEGMI